MRGFLDHFCHKTASNLDSNFPVDITKVLEISDSPLSGTKLIIDKKHNHVVP